MANVNLDIHVLTFDQDAVLIPLKLVLPLTASSVTVMHAMQRV